MENNSPLILIADDDKSTRIILKLILQQDGYQVIEAKNGEECLNIYKEKQPDMVLLDAIMPIVDGFTCCEKLQHISSNDITVPILMITGLDSQESVDKAFSAGATDYITKPIHPPVLRQRLRRILQANLAEKALRDSEQKYRYVVNNLKEVIFQIDLEGNLTFLNPAWQGMTGFSIQDSLGKKLLDFIHPGDHQSYLAYNCILLQNDKNQQSTPDLRYQLRYLHSDGSIGWIEICSCLMLAVDNSKAGFSGTLNDITEVKKREMYQNAEYNVTRVLAESPNIQEATPQVIRTICENLNWDMGEFWSVNNQKNILELISNWYPSINEFIEFATFTQNMTLKPGVGLPGIVWENNQPLWISDLTQEPESERLSILEKIGLKSSFYIPINSGKEKLGVINFFTHETKNNDIELMNFMGNIASQMAQFIKRKQAEEDSQHWTRMLQSELEQAAKYVASLLPNPKSVALSIEQQFVPSSQLGGDIFDYYWLDDDNLILYLLDVAGHGVRSALLSVSVLNMLRTQSLLNTNFYQPASVCAELNRVFQMNDDFDDNYFTLWYGVYNKSTQELAYSSAGHPPAILLTSLEDEVSIQQLSTQNIAIGLFPDMDFEQSSCILTKDSQLYIFSDGVYEITEEDGKIWGLEAFMELLKYHHSYNFPLDNVLTFVKSLNNGQVLEDDFSLLKLTVN